MPLCHRRQAQSAGRGRGTGSSRCRDANHGSCGAWTGHSPVVDPVARGRFGLAEALRSTWPAATPCQYYRGASRAWIGKVEALRLRQQSSPLGRKSTGSVSQRKRRAPGRARHDFVRRCWRVTESRRRIGPCVVPDFGLVSHRHEVSCDRTSGLEVFGEAYRIIAPCGRTVQAEIKSAKWLVWHGKASKAVARLKAIHDAFGLVPEAPYSPLWWNLRQT